MSVVSVIFKDNGKEYYFENVNELKLRPEDKVVVDTSGGLELGTIKEIDLENVKIKPENLSPVLRKASKKDINNYENNLIKAEQALEEFKDILVDFPELDMQLISAKYSLNQSKLLFMYVSDERVDFRQLLKRLASHFKKRIELKQIGSRDKAKLIGGLGPCGMEICCTRYLKEFANISINMAKNQMLSLNPTKISGLCGRLLCCLKYENDYYTKTKALFPKLGSKIEFEKETYKVTGLNIITDDIKLENQNGIRMIKRDELKHS